MEAAAFIVAALSGHVQGLPITSESIDLPRFNRFNEQVERLLLGSHKRHLLQGCHVQIASGAYALRLTLPPILAAELYEDLALLQESPSQLTALDPHRADVITEWQEWAQKETSLVFTLTAPGSASFPILAVTATSQFSHPADHWLGVEKYLAGTIYEMGGTSRINLHLRLADGRSVIVEAVEEYLREQTRNHLYHEELLRVSASQNLRTGELRDLKLLEFVDRPTAFDKSALAALIARATPRWQHVPDVTAWLETLRGHDRHA